MPRPRKDGTPATAANKRRLSAAFIETVRPNPSCPVAYWDTATPGLVLLVQPTGHRAFIYIYRVRGRGPRRFHIGNARSLSLSDARKMAMKLAYQVAEGADPHADRLALRGKGSFADVAKRYVDEYASKKNKSYRQAEALVARYLLPRWSRLDVGSIRRADVKAVIAAIEKPVLANQVLAAASAVFSWSVRQDIITVNPCIGIERNETKSRERILSDSEITAFWPHLSPALKMVLLTGQRPGEVAHLHRAHIVDGWWNLPGAPDPATGWTGTKNGQSHRVWLSKPASELLPELFANAVSINQMQVDMRDLCKQLGVREKATPHDLRRSFCSKVTQLGFGRDAMNRITNHREGGIADVYDRHKYAEENKRIMETVALHIVTIAEDGAGNIIAFR